MRFQVLGPLVVRDDDGAAVRLASRRQRLVLARLLVAGGQVVPAERILEDVWGPTPAPGGLGALQTTVSLLRRALEPERAPRAPARMLVSATPGYALRADDVDAHDFEVRVRGDDVAAIDEALALWTGPAYAEVASLPWAMAEAARLEELRVVARERRAALLLSGGGADQAAGDLEVLVAEAPLREEAWRLLALALYRAGRQGDALGALRRARAVLAEELGVDPGRPLRELEVAILEQAPWLDRAPAGLATAIGVPAGPGELEVGPVSEDEVVGRQRERVQVLAHARAAIAGGSARTVVVAGGPGLGKSVLADAVTRDLAREGWLTVWGRCPETEGAPALWPWSQVLESLTTAVAPTADEAGALDVEAGERGLAAPAARFRLVRSLCGYLGRVASQQPLLVVLDDLHRADEGTLAAVREVAADRRIGPVLVLGTFRPEEADDDLRDTLATLASTGGLRLDLEGLPEEDVGALVRSICARAGVEDRADPAAVASIVERTDGNPFYVTESARLLASEGRVVASDQVPAGVADVVRRRLARLPAPAQGVLHTVAVIGREAELQLVVAADVHEDVEVLDALEAAVVAGLLQEPTAGIVRFSHALVRDTVYADMPRLRRARTHARVAEALSTHGSVDVAALAHHHAEAASLGGADQAIRWCREAAAQAEQRFAHSAALDWWQRARSLATTFPREVAVRDRAEVLIGSARAMQLAGRGVEARATRAEAISVSQGLDDQVLLAQALTSIDVPLLWSNRAHAAVDDGLIELVRSSLASLPRSRTALRARLSATLALESGIWADPDGARRAAEEAVSLAAGVGDAEVTAVALNAAYYAHRLPSQLSRVTEIGASLVAHGAAHGMPGVEALGHLAGCVEPGARGDLDDLRPRVQRVEDLARTFDLPHLAVMVELQRAAWTAIRGDRDDAVGHYDAIGRSAVADGMYDVAAVATIGRICVHHVHGALAEAEEDIAAVESLYPVLAAPMRACLHAARGDVAAAVGLLRDTPEPAEDYLMTLLEGFRADAAVAVGLPDVAAQVYDRLLAHEELVCGGETNAMPLGPVALRLARIADLLDRPDAARRHWKRAAEVASAASSPVWEGLVSRPSAVG